MFFAYLASQPFPTTVLCVSLAGFLVCGILLAVRRAKKK